jgi:hypothetical protein
MKSINLIFGCHSHQPVGNFPFVFEEAYNRSYLPFLNVLERFPEVRVTLHYTGPLWDWIKAHRPEYIARVAQLVRQNQVEVMGGAYFEPLVCAIPQRDAVAQIERMNDFCLEHFGQKPRGMWLAERVWEPQMASTLAKGGIEYTALDDSHFTCSGVPADALNGYYITEDDGYTLKVFPILEHLRYLVPWHPVEEVVNYLRTLATEDGLRCAVLHDDGEKFGIWPGTYKSVFEEKWLENFFRALTDNQDWLHSITYSQYLDKAGNKGRIYLTCASYEEMMAWSLPTPVQRRLLKLQKEMKHSPAKSEQYGQFLRGGFWRNFLVKYPESNNIQKRMMRVSNRLNRLRGNALDGDVLLESERLLQEGQCNCAYWHGVFGGLYLNHLRTALYEKLIEADRALDAVEHPGDGWAHCEVYDFDGDGTSEAVLENNQLALFISPNDGGTLFELDYKPRPFNFLNTLSRREEPYHDLLRTGEADVVESGQGNASIHDLVQAKETGLEHYLTYDAYRRVALRDHLLHALPSPEAYMRGAQEDVGRFCCSPYALQHDGATVTLTRAETIGSKPTQVLQVQKRITLEAGASAFHIEYHVGNIAGGDFHGYLSVEFPVNLLTGSSADRYYVSRDRELGKPQLGGIGCEDELTHFGLRDEWMGLEIGLQLEVPARFYHFPIETVSQSEGGQERVYQGSVVAPTWRLECLAGGQETRTIRVEMAQLNNS